MEEEQQVAPLLIAETDDAKIRVQGPFVPSLKTILEGKLPSNDKIECTLTKGKEAIRAAAHEVHLDRRGQKLENDVVQLIDSTSLLLTERNSEEQLQQLVQDTAEGIHERDKHMAQRMKGDIMRGAPALRDDAANLFGFLKNLLWNFIQSEEFRTLLADWIKYIHSLGAHQLKQLAQTEKDMGIAKTIAAAVEEPHDTVDELKIQKETRAVLISLLSQIANKEEYHTAIRDMMTLIDSLKASVSTGESDSMQAFRYAFEDAFSLLGEFAGKRRLRQFREMLWTAYHSVREEPQVSGWFKELRQVLEHVIDKPDALMNSSMQQRIEVLARDARLILQNEKWRTLYTNVADKFFDVVEAVRSDAVTNEWKEKVQQLFKDLILDSNGEPDLFVLEDSMHQLRNIIVPLFKMTLSNIPIRKIEIFTSHYEIKVEDIVVDVTTFLPEHMDLRTLNVSHLDLTERHKDYQKHQLLLRVDHIKPEFRHLKFYYRRNAFPAIEDYGVADVGLAGEGATLSVLWTITQRGHETPVAELSDIICEIDRLNIHIVGEATKHNWLDTFLVPLLSGMLKNRLAGTIEDYLKGKLTHINDKINDLLRARPKDKVLSRMNEAMKLAYHQLEHKK